LAQMCWIWCSAVRREMCNLVATSRVSTSGGDLAEHLDLAVRQTFRPPRPRWALPGNDEDRTVTSQTALRICPFTSRR